MSGRTVATVAAATGRSETTIRNAVFDVQARAWAQHKMLLSKTDALDGIGTVLAFDVALRGPSEPVAASTQDGAACAPLDVMALVRGR